MRLLRRYPFVAMVIVMTASAAFADRIWFDGTRDEADGPPGKLLSDNLGYWGEVVLTGCVYRYETAPTHPPDVASFGGPVPNRLVDGRVRGYKVGVGSGPLVVVFDFQRRCTFAEIDLATATDLAMASKFEVSDAGDNWQTIHEQLLQDCVSAELHRFVLDSRPSGQYLRLTLQGKTSTRLEEVYVWGDAQVDEKHPEAVRPRVAPQPITEVAFRSIPGIAKTSLTDHEFHAWRMALGGQRAGPAVWSTVSTWGEITNNQILPGPCERVDTIRLVMARNETEPVALALTSTELERPRQMRVVLDGFHAEGGAAATQVSGKLRVAGAIPSRDHGVNLGPLFEADNLLGASLMRRYLSNGRGIATFPDITLSPAGSAVFWLTVTTNGAPAGTYRSTLRCEGGPTLTILVDVVDVTLPDPLVWIRGWSYTTGLRAHPFVYDDRREREVAYRQNIGMNVWLGMPTPDHPGMHARKTGRVYFQLNATGDLERTIMTRPITPDKVTDYQKQYLLDYLGDILERTRELGLDYDEWFLELWDEPGKGSGTSYGTFAKLLKQIDPNVRIYANPCFWAGWSRDGVHGDDVVSAELDPWYNQLVDISVPLFLLIDNPMPRSNRIFDKPGRFVNAFYTVNGQHGKSERASQIQYYRKMAWEAFRRGWNGWGFYAYYAPRGNPWDDFDQAIYGEAMPDYQTVYPGPRGPIPTRQTESVREGWEDYRLLSQLKQRGLTPQLDAILADYAGGESFVQLRQKALKAAAGR